MQQLHMENLNIQKLLSLPLTKPIRRQYSWFWWMAIGKSGPSQGETSLINVQGVQNTHRQASMETNALTKT